MDTGPDGMPARRGLAIWRPPELLSLIGFNGVAQLLPLLAALAITPLLLGRLGLDRYGIWSLALAVLSTLAALDGGVSASLARFFALHGVRGERVQAGRLLIAAMLLFAMFGLILSFVAVPVAPAVVGLLSIPPRLQGEAVLVLRWLPALAALGLMADSAAAVLEGNSRFRQLAISTLAATAAYAVAVLVLVPRGSDLSGLIVAMAARYGVLGATSALFARSHVRLRPAGLPDAATARELWRFSSRMQLSALTSFVNGELDALVIAAVLPVRYVGLYGIGMQAASAARSLPLYAFSPLLTVLARTFGSRGRLAARTEFARLEGRWLSGVLSYGAVAVAAVGFSVILWLGNRYQLAGQAAALLLIGFIVQVALTGMRTCYVRAVGRPGLETRYSAVWTAGNAVLTIPLALVAGVLGVVGTTTVTGVVACAYYVRLCRQTEELPVILPGWRWLASVFAAVGLTLAGEFVILQLNTHGLLGLVLSGLPPLGGFGLVLSVNHRRMFSTT
jgi:O-antigen/teichoic acid export membrane protein